MQYALFLYDIISLITSGIGITLLILLYRKEKVHRLIDFLLCVSLVALIVAVLALDQFLNLLGYEGPYRGNIWNSTLLWCSCLAVFIPRAFAPHRPGGYTVFAERFFLVLGTVLGSLNLLHLILPPPLPLFLLLYTATFTLLSLAILHAGILVVIERKKPRPNAAASVSS